MKRAIREIEKDFMEIKKGKASYKQNLALVELMNELETYYHAMRLYSSENELELDLKKDEAVKLYREISLSRTETSV